MSDDCESLADVIRGLRVELFGLVFAVPASERAGADALGLLLSRVQHMPRRARRGFDGG